MGLSGNHLYYQHADTSVWPTVLTWIDGALSFTQSGTWGPLRGGYLPGVSAGLQIHTPANVITSGDIRVIASMKTLWSKSLYNHQNKITVYGPSNAVIHQDASAVVVGGNKTGDVTVTTDVTLSGVSPRTISLTHSQVASTVTYTIEWSITVVLDPGVPDPGIGGSDRFGWGDKRGAEGVRRGVKPPGVIKPTPEQKQPVGLVQGVMPASDNEWFVALALDKLGIEYQYQVPLAGGRRVRGGIVLDFVATMPPVRKAIFVGSGGYWHRNVKKQEDDLAHILAGVYYGQENVIDLDEDETSSESRALDSVRKKVL